MDHDHIHSGSDQRVQDDRRQDERRRESVPVKLDRRSGAHRRQDSERRNRVSEILVTPIMIRRPYSRFRPVAGSGP